MEKETQSQIPTAEKQIRQLAELLMDKLYQAVGELDVYIAVSKTLKKETLFQEDRKSVV